MEKTYEQLLADAPPQNTPEFLDYLRSNNNVIYDKDGWLIIENAKYHKADSPWYTAFYKDDLKERLGIKGLRRYPDPTWEDWHFEIGTLWRDYKDWEWIKKAPSRQTVPGRFHIHLIKKTDATNKKVPVLQAETPSIHGKTSPPVDT